MYGALDWRRPLGRRRYAVVGGALALLKYNLDRLIALAHGRYWSPLDYWVPASFGIDELPGREPLFYVEMLVLAVPFVWIGVALTLRRLRDADLPGWLVLAFFVPFVNILLFLTLCVVPSQREDVGRTRLERVMPRTGLGSAALAVLVTSVLGIAVTVLAAEILESYGWGLFVGTPFAMGLVAAVLYGFHAPRSAGACVLVALGSAGVAAGLLAGLALEGLICIVMAAPLVAPLAALGGLVGYTLQRRHTLVRANGAYSIALALPLLVAAEAVVDARPAVLPVETSVVVAAPPEVVWRRVVAFPELEPPRELAFRVGIAYPVGARIDGHGVGAVRRCRFSTGDFVEPITVWDEPRRLAFRVAKQPAPMVETSPWGRIHPPHLDGFLHSRRGEFRLTPLAGGRTLLTGTTWYENRMWPERYWRLWSDALIHRIHARVLRHVAALAEHDALAGRAARSRYSAASSRCADARATASDSRTLARDSARRGTSATCGT